MVNDPEIMKGVLRLIGLIEPKGSPNPAFKTLDDALDYLRFLIVYLKFDLEATTRERDAKAD